MDVNAELYLETRFCSVQGERHNEIQKRDSQKTGTHAQFCITLA
jgi:hypothetical protein